MTRTGIEQGGGAKHRNQSPSGALVSPRVPTSRNVYRGCCTRKGVFNLTRTGIEQGGGAQHRNQSPSGALVSPRVPISRNVYRGCCFMQPVRGIEGTRPPAGGKKEPSGLFFSVSGCGSQHPRVPWAALASCWPLPQQLLLASATGRSRRCCRFHPVGMSTVDAAAKTRTGIEPISRNVYRGSCR